MPSSKVSNLLLFVSCLSKCFYPLTGAVKDVYVVPVSISYEKLIDGSFIDEQLGKSKQFENFGDASKAIWAALHSNYGIARVDFSKPFLLKEYLSQVINTESAIESAGQSPSVNLIYKCVACAGKSHVVVCLASFIDRLLYRSRIVKQNQSFSND